MRPEISLEIIIKALAGLGPIRSQGMFGGNGLYYREAIFAIFWKGRLYLKSGTPLVVAGRRLNYFRPRSNFSSKKYFEVPRAVFAREGGLLRLVKKALRSAARPSTDFYT